MASAKGLSPEVVALGWLLGLSPQMLVRRSPIRVW
jgi:hypothetical protein